MPFTVLLTLAEVNVAVVVPVIVGLAIDGVVASTTAPLPEVPFERSLAAGWAAEGTPDVEMALRNLLGCAAKD